MKQLLNRTAVKEYTIYNLVHQNLGGKTASENSFVLLFPNGPSCTYEPGNPALLFDPISA